MMAPTRPTDGRAVRKGKAAGGIRRRKQVRKPGQTKVRTQARPAGRRGAGSGARKAAAAAGQAFEGLEGGDGCGTLLVIVERTGGEWDRVDRKCEVSLSLKRGGRGAGKARRGRAISVAKATRKLAQVCQGLAALGHPQRAKLMSKLLEGPGTYGALKRATGLKPGPLYHHVSQLRLAGLILPKQRDLYELTRGGRNLILTAMAAGPLIRDTRARPVGIVHDS